MTTIRQNFVAAADPLGTLSEPGEVFKNPGQTEFIRTFLKLTRDTFSKCVMRDRPQPNILLQAPGGKVFSVSVADDGSVSSTYIRG